MSRAANRREGVKKGREHSVSTAGKKEVLKGITAAAVLSGT